MNKKIKYLILDIDGTMTDGKVYIGNHGEVFKAFSIKDGYGIHDIAIPHEIEPIVITGRESNIVTNRCNELGIQKVYQGISNKYGVLEKIISDFSEAAYIGDDLNDEESMKNIKAAGGVVGCPQDAVDEIKNISDFISKRNGGNGAVREFIEWLTENVQK